MLGPLHKATYSEGKLHVFPGDVLVMYTDGLVERHGIDIDRGMAQAEQIIADWDDDTVLAESCDLLQNHLAPRPRADDVCIIAVRFTA